METVNTPLEMELQSELVAVRISLAELKKGVRGLLEDNLDEDSEQITVSLEEANDFLRSHRVAELEIEREYNVRGTVKLSFDITIRATSEEDAKSQAENASFHLECYDAEALDYEELSMHIDEVERADLS